jgi:hypothetical protein
VEIEDEVDRGIRDIVSHTPHSRTTVNKSNRTSSLVPPRMDTSVDVLRLGEGR